MGKETPQQRLGQEQHRGERQKQTFLRRKEIHINQKTNDPTLKQRFMAMVRDTKDMKDLAMLRSAQKTAIAYYFDMTSALLTHRIKKADELELPDQEYMRKAVTEINRICANQNKEDLFTGDIMNPKDLFIFASGIAMPTKEQKEGKNRKKADLRRQRIWRNKAMPMHSAIWAPAIGMARV